MGLKRENREKIKNWSKKIKRIEKSELTQAKQKARSFSDISTTEGEEEFEDAQYAIDSIQHRISSIKKIIKVLKREK